MSIVVLMILKLHMNDVITLIMQVLVGAVLYIGALPETQEKMDILAAEMEKYIDERIRNKK